MKLILKKQGKRFLLILLFNSLSFVQASSLPKGFVYLEKINPTIVQEIRYAGYHNFIGHPIKGYQTATCILTKPAAMALNQVQNELKKLALSLKVYDCYRPQMAVAEFFAWSKSPYQDAMQQEFYPRLNKTDLFKQSYIALQSGHSRGSTVDLTIIPLSSSASAVYHQGQRLTSCFSPSKKRFHDNSIDMGTGYDCMDELSHNDNKTINSQAYSNRQLLRRVMEKHGFVPYQQEWWHFTLLDEPYPQTYFNFVVR